MAKNIKDLLSQASAFPAAIEAKLPEGAPKLSETLVDVTSKLPAIPDLPMEVPDLPAPPELPEMPEIPGAAGLARPFRGPTVTVTPRSERREIIPSPAVGLIPEVITRRGI